MSSISQNQTYNKIRKGQVAKKRLVKRSDPAEKKTPIEANSLGIIGGNGYAMD